MPNAENQVVSAAKEFYSVIVQRLKNADGVHAETAITAAARMAGTFLLRSFNLPIQALTPGAAVLSDAANEKGPMLIETLGRTLDAMGIAINPNANEVGDAQPKISVLQTQELLEDALIAVQKKYALNQEEAARGCALATAILVRDCAGVLDVNVAFGLAAYGFVEGSKTVPWKPQAPAETQAKPWYKMW